MFNCVQFYIFDSVLKVGNKFLSIKNVPLDQPGEFYYNLIPKGVSVLVQLDVK